MGVLESLKPEHLESHYRMHLAQDLLIYDIDNDLALRKSEEADELMDELMF
jgi:hypothetical protein